MKSGIIGGKQPMKWYMCPECGQKLFIVHPDALIRGMEIKCKKCRQIIKVSLEPDKSK